MIFNQVADKRKTKPKYISPNHPFIFNSNATGAFRCESSLMVSPNSSSRSIEGLSPAGRRVLVGGAVVLVSRLEPYTRFLLS